LEIYSDHKIHQEIKDSAHFLTNNKIKKKGKKKKRKKK
jgi:hypothetical protein